MATNYPALHAKAKASRPISFKAGPTNEPRMTPKGIQPETKPATEAQAPVFYILQTQRQNRKRRKA